MAGLLDEPYIGYPQLARRRAVPNTDVETSKGLLRGISYYPYDLLGAPIDLMNMAITPLGMGSKTPVMGSDYLQGLAQRAGLSLPKTDSSSENIGRILSSIINPAVGARAVGKVIDPAMQAVAPVGRAVGEQAYRMTEDLLQSQGLMPSITPRSQVPMQTTNVGSQPFDPRFDKRVQEQERLRNLTTVIEGQRTPAQQQLSLVDFEGRPFITSMADRTAAGGELVKINDVVLNRPVGLLGGQDWMFNNPSVWAAGKAPAKQVMELAQNLKQTTGQNPLYLPYRMTPSGGDFSNMTYETMLNYAESAMTKADKKDLNKTIKEFIPDWKGIDSRESIQQFRETPDLVRKAIMKQIDVQFRDVGGLNIGETRLAVTDPKQLSKPDLDVMNIGEIFADKPLIMQSGHPSYLRGIPGQGLGIIDQPRNVYELLPNLANARGITDPRNYSDADRRVMEMKPYGGIIDEKLLKSLGY
jgi:hypothetical protein